MNKPVHKLVRMLMTAAVMLCSSAFVPDRAADPVKIKALMIPKFETGGNERR
ncbi:MAG: hypothetical protein Q4G19_00260 [Clostridia bacterium]|nr:hypothetical protein [Clostridia bacterium]